MARDTCEHRLINDVRTPTPPRLALMYFQEPLPPNGCISSLKAATVAEDMMDEASVGHGHDIIGLVLSKRS